ncbi:Uncharacterised protein [Mycobacteroides abscessus subsp. abscessus]|nr:Uncharacterised protein [Mycobacteroides abscessus subsp. abscessus]SKW50924.1 Uncharacterised protein [Mycobacteroides abscessus subsp. abscessus]
MSSNVERTLYSQAKPPATLSAATLPLVTTPYLPNSSSACMCERSVPSASLSGSIDQRPATAGSTGAAVVIGV